MKLAFLALAAATLAACTSSSSENVGADDAFATVHPSGTDLPGAIVLELPAGVAAATDLDSMQIDATAVTPGQVVGGLPVGAHTVTVRGITDTVEVTSNTTVRYKLAAVKLKLPTEPTFGVNARAYGAEGQNGGNIVIGLAYSGSGAFVLDQPNESDVLLLPHGALTLSWGVGDGTSFDAPAGNVTVVDLGSTAGRKLVRLHAPKRGLSDAPSGLNHATWQIGNAHTAPRNVQVLDEETVVVGTTASAPVLTIQLPFVTGIGIPLPLAAAGAPPLDQNIARIDVTDVALTKTGGAVETVKGYYKVSSALTAMSQGVNTGTGVDVWPGDYEVDTSYQTVESGWKTDVQTIHVTN